MAQQIVATPIGSLSITERTPSLKVELTITTKLRAELRDGLARLPWVRHPGNKQQILNLGQLDNQTRILDLLVPLCFLLRAHEGASWCTVPDVDLDRLIRVVGLYANHPGADSIRHEVGRRSCELRTLKASGLTVRGISRDLALMLARAVALAEVEYEVSLLTPTP